MKTSDQINELAAALAKAQKSLGAAKKDATNPHFRSTYATLASAWAAWQAVGPDNGLAVIQSVASEDDASIVATRLVHSSGQWIESEIRLRLQKDDMQGMGSAITYARRYSLMAITGIAPADDDDGNAAVAAGAKAAPKKAAPNKPPAAKTTPKEWADGFIQSMKDAVSIEDLNNGWDQNKKALEKMQAEHPSEYERIGQTYDEVRLDLEAAESEAHNLAAAG